MKKFFKTALLTMAFVACIGFAAMDDESMILASASGGNSGTTPSGSGGDSETDNPGNEGEDPTTPPTDNPGDPGETPSKPDPTPGTTTSGNSGSKPTADTEAMQKATTVAVKTADGKTVAVEVKAVTKNVQEEAENQAWSSVDAGNGSSYYYKAPGASVVTVDVVVTGDTKPDGSVTVTLNHASIEAGATYVVNHKKSDGTWEQKVVKAGAAGKFDVDLTSLSPVSFYKVVEYTYGHSGSCGPTDYNGNLNSMIGGTPEGGVIRITKEDGRDSLDLDMVKRIVNRNLTLVMEYTYNGADYRIVIPGKKAVIDESVPIYGPLYLAAHYSSNAAVGGSSNGVTYTIAKGDTLSKIAAVNGTTVAALAALNPQIKDVNVIYTGQSIKLK